MAKQRAPPKQTKAEPGLGSSPADYQSLESAIFSSSGDSRAHIDTLKMQSSSSKNYYDKVFADYEARRAPFAAQLDKSNQTWAALQQQHTYLKQQLLAVEGEMAAEQNRSAALMNTLSSLQADHEKQLGALNSSQSHVLQAMEKDKQMRALLESVRGMEQAVDDVVVSSLRPTGARADGGLGSRVPSVSPETLIAGFLAYAASEAACVNVLSKRVCLMRDNRANLQREVMDYKNLGMQVG